MSVNGTGLDLSDVANDLLLDLCASSDYFIVQEVGGSEDPDTGKYTPGSEVRTQLDSALEDTTSFGLINPINIESGDIFLMIPPKNPLPDDLAWMEIRGDRYSIVDRLPFYNTGVLQYTEIQVRRS